MRVYAGPIELAGQPFEFNAKDFTDLLQNRGASETNIRQFAKLLMEIDGDHNSLSRTDLEWGLALDLAQFQRGEGQAPPQLTWSTARLGDLEFDWGAFFAVLRMKASVYQSQLRRSDRTLKLVVSIDDNTPQNFAVLLVDAAVSKDLCPDFFGRDAEIDWMAEVLGAANDAHTPVFEFTYRGAPTNPILAQHRKPSWVVAEKPSLSPFTDTVLLDELKSLGITDIVVMGFDQRYCVKEAVQDATDLGFRVHVSFSTMQAHTVSAYSARAVQDIDEYCVSFYEQHSTLHSDHKKLMGLF